MTKTALVTGGGRGLGKNMALKLAEQGHDVILTYHHDQNAAEQVATEIQKFGRQAVAFRLDVGDSKSFDAFFKEISTYLKQKNGSPKFDFLINNAGIAQDTLIAGADEEVLDAMYRVHLKGTYMLTSKAYPLLNDNGRVINISSGLTRITTLNRSAYASMKGAVDVFTKYAAEEFGIRGITVNAVAPGLVQTDMTKSSFADEKIVEITRANTALGRTATPDDIGGVVAFLCSDAARWITGQRIEASGGLFL